MAILGYWEMPEEDVPPEEYWGDDEAIGEWFEAVKQRRKNPDAVTDEKLEEVPMMSNEAAAGLRDGKSATGSRRG